MAVIEISNEFPPVGFELSKLRALLGTPPTKKKLENSPGETQWKMGTLYKDYMGLYRVYTIATWLREHPYCDVGHQLIPSDRFGRNMLCQEVHSCLYRKVIHRSDQLGF
jgi:hypothetical protein